VMFVPQMYFYGVVGTATAVMNSRRRFALAAAAPAVENVGTIAVLLTAAVIYGTGSSLGQVPTGELLLLGLGSTAAVGLHAATQWWGAKRSGVVLVPRAGWRDPEVRVVIRRALPSLAQAGLDSLEILALLVGANRLPGGVVAFQIALNFYYLANALGTTPVALSLLPRLARMHDAGDQPAYRETLARGLSLGFFVTIPAGVAYLVLAGPLARALAFGRMNSPEGVTMVAVSLAPLALAVVGQTGFMIATYAWYARKDTRTPLRSTVLEAVVCLALVSVAFTLHGLAVLVVLGLAMSVSVSAAAWHMLSRLWRSLGGHGWRLLAPSLGRFGAGALIMAGPAWLTATAVERSVGGGLGPRLGVLAGAVVGTAVYVGVQALWRTPEVSWLAGGVSHLRGKATAAVTEGSNG
jgi:putative peptidoglycan lipid II flippase